MSQQSRHAGLSFFGMVGGVMAALKLKQRWDDHNPVAADEEGRVALTSAPLAASAPYGDVDDVTTGLLNPDAPYKRKRRTGCCICCGIDCTLFWKAFGIVVAGLAIWNAVKLIIWAVSDAPTGLELMPAFSTSLGCLTAPHIYNSSKLVMTAPMGAQFDHSFDIRGSAVGSFVITQGDTDLKDVKYEMTLRSADAALLDDVDIRFPDIGDDGSIVNSRLIITTPRTGSDSGCMRFDIIMHVPRTLQKLHVASHTAMHVQFDPAANIDLDKLYVTMFSMNKDNLILPSQGVRGNHMALEVYRGWIVGDVSVINSTAITTQRGDGITNVRAHPTAPLDPTNPDNAYFRTTTGAGRTDIFYITPKAFKRTIRNVHMSSRNADMYLTYRDAEFNGRVELDSSSYTATGLHAYPSPPSKEEGDGSPRWTHWFGNQEGGDQVYVKSRGWSGLYF